MKTEKILGDNHEQLFVEIAGNMYTFIHTDKTGNFEKDLYTVKAILDKPACMITAADRMQLLRIYRPSWHDSGKIEGIMSYDSSATNCGFCEAMRDAAAKNPMIICGYCYDYDQEHGFKGVNVLNRHSLNMLIMASMEFTVEELATLNIGYLNRINSSGDVPNIVYACNMLKLAIANPNKRFAFWAKNKAAVIAACDKLGKPANVILVQSSIMIGKADKLEKYFDFVFTVYLDHEEVEKAVKAGAGECNGKKCKDCDYSCYYGTWLEAGITNVAEFLRVPPATRKEMIKLCGRQ